MSVVEKHVYTSLYGLYEREGQLPGSFPNNFGSRLSLWERFDAEIFL
jgi:hypothetical protein